MIRRDALGYGLTLSGDVPVFVQTVRPGGAAERAGVREGDVILRVDGQRVTEAMHTEVVNMIQGTADLITPPPPPLPPRPDLHTLLFIAAAAPVPASEKFLSAPPSLPPPPIFLPFFTTSISPHYSNGEIGGMI